MCSLVGLFHELASRTAGFYQRLPICYAPVHARSHVTMPQGCPPKHKGQPEARKPCLLCNSIRTSGNTNMGGSETPTLDQKTLLWENKWLSSLGASWHSAMVSFTGCTSQSAPRNFAELASTICVGSLPPTCAAPAPAASPLPHHCQHPLFERNLPQCQEAL